MTTANSKDLPILEHSNIPTNEGQSPRTFEPSDARTLEHSNVKTLYLSFDLPLYTREIPQWRGAFIEMAGWQDDRFHNHTKESDAWKYQYRYPLIQYRVRRKKAALFAVNEGVQALQQVLATSDWSIHWKGEHKILQVEDLRMHQHRLKVDGAQQTYKLYKWLALNQENYRRWQQCKGLIERIQLLEGILQGHLLACLWGLGWQGNFRPKVRIQEMRKAEVVPLKGIPHMVFDIVYTTHVQLPNHIALGKAVSHGFGWQVKENGSK
ncbi:MAG: CRISPR-associated endonuclease Cas6 [Bacteroidota bacterium]